MYVTYSEKLNIMVEVRGLDTGYIEIIIIIL